MTDVRMFTKDERSTFAYWFAHWCAFQMTALNLKVWKFKYLFHDIEKPWLRLIWRYEKVQKVHRDHNRHHMEYGAFGTIDIEAMIIDWECSRFTKIASPKTARQEWEDLKEQWTREGRLQDKYYYHPELKDMDNKLDQLGL